VYPLLETTSQSVVATYFERITGRAVTDTDAIAETVNQLSFQLEEQLATYSPAQIRAEVAAYLEELRQQTYRAELRELRAALHAPDADETTLLAQIEALTQKLSGDVLTESIFTG